jgi:hypothetical protein
VFGLIVKRAVLILLCLLLLIGPVAAYYADSVSFAPSDPSTNWIIADTGQNNVIILVAKNITQGSFVENAQVSFTLDNPLLGTISPKNTQTNTLGVANCTFTVNSTHPTSGTATITADLLSTDQSGKTYHTVRTWVQNIDHNVPYKAVFNYSTSTAVESILPVKLSLFDRWDNRIDNKRPVPTHNVTLHVNGPSPPNNCGFTDFGLLHDKNFNLDSNGELTFNITPVTKPGYHYILMDAIGSIPEQMEMFNTEANGAPVKINQSFSPDGTPYATVLADGRSQFTFYYTLWDKYGNPTQDQYIWVNTSDGTQTLQKTLETGQSWATFGPKSFTGIYTITATPVGNPSLQLTKQVRFYNTSPTNLDITANPESMPSRDANPLIYSNISAKVTDIMGNGVAKETVTFTFHDVTNSPTTATVTTAPSFSKTSTLLTTTAQTDDNGYATVKFYPGAYATLNQVGYQQAVAGAAKVTATWNGNEIDEPVTWKNYPYLSAIVAVNPQQVKVGDTVNVSIKLNGDGWALYRYPIDVNLVLDRSGSMGDAISATDTTTRLSIAKAAAVNFIGQMSTDRDRAGLWSYSEEGDVQQNAILQSPFGPVTTAVNKLSKDSSTSTREAVKDAIADMIATPNANSNAVRAIVVMTDGNWNDAGSPIAHGTGWPAGNPDWSSDGNSIYPNDYRYYPTLGGTLTSYCDAFSSSVCDVCASGYTAGTGSNTGKCCKSGTCYTPSSRSSSCTTRHCTDTEYKCTDGEFTTQNLSVYAKNNNIRLYFIFFAGTPDDTAVTDLTAAAVGTGGFYQKATSAAELNDAYKKIAGDLQTEAGVDTQMSLDFGSLIINKVAVGPNAQVFEYVGDPVVATGSPAIQPGSTMLDKYNKTPAGAINKHLIPGIDVSTSLPFTKVGPIITNQTDYWNNNQQSLAFNIGTINVNETWQADFRLRVLKEGNILVFGPDSHLTFTGGQADPSYNTMTLPNLSLSSSLNPSNVGVTEKTITITGLTRTDGGKDDPVKSTLPVSWTTSYNGADTITEEVSYISNSNSAVPVKFDVKTLNPADLYSTQSSVLNTEKLPPGGYTIQVHAYTTDASDTKECGPYSFTSAGRSFIKIE